MDKTIIKYLLLLFVSLNICADDIQMQEIKDQIKSLTKRLESYDDMKAQLKELTKRLEAYEKQEPKQNNFIDYTLKEAAPIIHKPHSEGLNLKTEDTSISVGGRIQLHSVYAWPEGSFFAGTIPLDKESLGEDGQLTLSARDSRLWVKTRTPSEYGPIRALIETDFLGTASGTEVNTNSHGIRLRHAYIQGAGFTVGQTNSAFNSLVTLDTISYAVNDTLVRQPLIRYSFDEKDFTYDISLEQPETTLLDSSAEIITPKDDILPDIVGRIRYYPSWGEASAAFLARVIKQDHASLSDGTVLNSSDEAFAWGTNVSAKIKVLNLDDIRFDAQYGVGMGRYIAYDAYAAGFVDSDGKIKLQASFGAHLGYRHWWSEKLRSTLALSYAGTDNDIKNIQADDLYKVNKDAYSLQLNLLWIPIKNALVGVEYAKAVRDVESGDKGYIDMLIFLVRYDF